MELFQLRTFQEVAATLNFTRAAERLHLTQSAVSHQIKALEEELGEPLFIRAKHGVKLSQAGAVALEHARRILEESVALKERLSGGEQTPVGRVRAAAATQAFVHLFAPLFETFMRAHPGVEVSFRTTQSTDQTIADIQNGAADVGFASLPVYSPALAVQELFEDELLVIVGHGHRLAGRPLATFEEIVAERFILFERGNSIRRATDEFFGRVGGEPRTALESNDTSFIKIMVQRGLGISLLPAWAVRDEVRWGWLAQLRIDGHRLRRTVAILALGRFQPSPTRAFVRHTLQNRASLQTMAEGEATLDAPARGAEKRGPAKR
jgi:LysR family cyn operon transcriptional activator